MVLFQALQTEVCKAKIKRKKVKEHVKTNIYTTTKTFVHATMHVKCFKIVFIKSHAHSSHFSAMAVISHFYRTEPCKEERLLIKNGYSVFILQCKGDKVK